MTGGTFKWITLARVALTERIRVVVLVKSIEDDIPPDNKIEVTGYTTFVEEATTLARLARLLRKIKKENGASGG